MEAKIMRTLGKTLSQWEALSEYDRGWAIQLERAEADMRAWERQLRKEKQEREERLRKAKGTRSNRR